MFQVLPSLYEGAQVSTCRRHMYMQEQRRVLCPLVQDQWGLYLMGWNEFSRKSTLGCAGIIMVYHITLTILNLTLYPLIQLEKLSFLLAMAMRFVIIKQVLIVFIVVLMNKEKDHSLGWVILGVWCSVV